jgi:hypothetical protein
MSRPGAQSRQSDMAHRCTMIRLSGRHAGWLKAENAAGTGNDRASILRHLPSFDPQDDDFLPQSRRRLG